MPNPTRHLTPPLRRVQRDNQSPDSQATKRLRGRPGRQSGAAHLYSAPRVGRPIRPPGPPILPAERVFRRVSKSAFAGFAGSPVGSAKPCCVVEQQVRRRRNPARGRRGLARLVTTVPRRTGGRIVVGGARTVTGLVGADWAPTLGGTPTCGHLRGHWSRRLGDGCPTDASTEACAQGWTVARRLFHISTGAARGVRGLPEIYRTDGIPARQWAAISAWGVRSAKGRSGRCRRAQAERAACPQNVHGLAPRTTDTSSDVATPATRLTKGPMAG